MDYRDFLDANEMLVLPYLGGSHVSGENRRLRVVQPTSQQRSRQARRARRREAENRDQAQPSGQLAKGWWQFAVTGRRAEPKEQVFAPDDLYARPSARGHAVDGWLFISGREIAHLQLLPEEEMAPLTPCRARRWHDGELLFDCVELEDEAEEQARLALEERRPIAEVKGVGSSLRAAYGFALVTAIGRDLAIPVSPREAQSQVLALAEQGRPGAEAFLRHLDEQRIAHEAERQARIAQARAQRDQARQREQTQRDQARWQRHAQREQARWEQERGYCRQRAAEALAAAGANMLGTRIIGNNQIEVTFRFMGERFISIADIETLNVIDSGICLSGADSELTLESLPSAIREAIDTDVLYITRR